MAFIYSSNLYPESTTSNTGWTGTPDYGSSNIHLNIADGSGTGEYIINTDGSSTFRVGLAVPGPLDATTDWTAVAYNLGISRHTGSGTQDIQIRLYIGGVLENTRTISVGYSGGTTTSYTSLTTGSYSYADLENIELELVFTGGYSGGTYRCWSARASLRATVADVNGVLGGGDNEPFNIYNETVSGGISGGGAVDDSQIYSPDASGGISGGGVADFTYTISSSVFDVQLISTEYENVTGTTYDGSSLHLNLTDGTLADDPNYLTTGTTSYVIIPNGSSHLANYAEFGFDKSSFDANDHIVSITYHLLGEKEGTGSVNGAVPGISFEIGSDKAFFPYNAGTTSASYETEQITLADLYDLGYTTQDFIDSAVLRIDPYPYPGSAGSYYLYNLYLEFEVTYISEGGAALGGTSEPFSSYDEIPSGGMSAAGAATYTYEESGSGGISAAGTATYVYEETGSGGILGGGDSLDNMIIQEVTSGGVAAGGLVNISIYEEGSGGLEAAGNVHDSHLANIDNAYQMVPDSTVSNSGWTGTPNDPDLHLNINDGVKWGTSGYLSTGASTYCTGTSLYAIFRVTLSDPRVATEDELISIDYSDLFGRASSTPSGIDSIHVRLYINGTLADSSFGGCSTTGTATAGCHRANTIPNDSFGNPYEASDFNNAELEIEVTAYVGDINLYFANAELISAFPASGGLGAGETASTTFYMGIIPSGGAVLAGTADESYIHTPITYDEVGSGGVQAGGNACFLYDEEGSGGLEAAGNVHDSHLANIDNAYLMVPDSTVSTSGWTGTPNDPDLHLNINDGVKWGTSGFLSTGTSTYCTGTSLYADFRVTLSDPRVATEDELISVDCSVLIGRASSTPSGIDSIRARLYINGTLADSLLVSAATSSVAVGGGHNTNTIPNDSFGNPYEASDFNNADLEIEVTAYVGDINLYFANLELISTFPASGGLGAGGTALISADFISSGGVLLAGTADVSDFHIPQTYNEVGSGGIVGGGQYYWIYDEEGSGGLEAAGNVHDSHLVHRGSIILMVPDSTVSNSGWTGTPNDPDLHLNLDDGVVWEDPNFSTTGTSSYVTSSSGSDTFRFTLTNPDVLDNDELVGIRCAEISARVSASPVGTTWVRYTLYKDGVSAITNFGSSVRDETNTTYGGSLSTSSIPVDGFGNPWTVSDFEQDTFEVLGSFVEYNGDINIAVLQGELVTAYSPTGGLGGAGTATISTAEVFIASGGLAGGGAADVSVNHIYTIEGSGGVLAAGEAADSQIANETISGGLQANGFSLSIYDDIGSGGLLAGTAADESVLSSKSSVNLIFPDSTVSSSGWYGNVYYHNLDENLNDGVSYDDPNILSTGTSSYIYSSGSSSVCRLTMEDLAISDGEEIVELNLTVVGSLRDGTPSGITIVFFNLYIDGNLAFDSPQFGAFGAINTTFSANQSNNSNTENLTVAQFNTAEIEVTYENPSVGSVTDYNDDLKLAQFHIEVVSAYSPTGGLGAGGSAGVTGVTNIADISGGVEAAGIGGQSFNEEGSGGILAAGLVLISEYIDGSGGILAAGDSTTEYIFLASGGVVAAGTVSSTFYDEVAGEGGVVLGGDSEINKNSSYSYSGSGTVVISGSSTAEITEVKYLGSGNITIGGTSSSYYKFNLVNIYLWNVRAYIYSDLTFYWNVGELQAFYYRVVGQATTDDECLPKKDCCQRVIINVRARTLSELCQKLGTRNFIGPIESVEKFGRPIDTTITDDICNDLTPVEVCEIPACADYCVDHDVLERIGWNAIVQVDSFYEYEATPSIYISGISNYSYVANLTSLSYEGSGDVTISGEANYSASDYIANITGESVIMSGEAAVISSAYSFIGGRAPVKNYDRGSDVIELDNSGESWSVQERILQDDGLTTQCDVSYGKTSQLIVARGFDLAVPDGMTVTGMKVAIKRYASTTGIRDDKVYLVLGSEIISDDLADTSNDWPLINTGKIYGSNGFNGNTPWRDPDSVDYLGPWDIDDINDQTFGVAIAVNNESNPQSGAIAKIDYVEITVFYEDADHQRVRISGSSTVSATDYSFVGDATVAISSNNVYRKSGKFAVDTSIPVTVLGTYARNYYYSSEFGDIVNPASTGVSTSGMAEVSPYYYTDHPVGFVNLSGTASVSVGTSPFIGVGVGGSAKVTPYEIEVSGGLSSNGSAKATPYEIEASGGLSISGGIDQPLSVSGSAVYRSSYTTETSSGGSVLNGSAIVTPYFETASGGLRASAPNHFRFDSEDRGTTGYSSNMVNATSGIVKLGDVSSGEYGHVYKIFTGLASDTTYKVTLTGITDDNLSSPNNSMIVEVGTAVLYLYQSEGVSVEFEATGYVTSDSNGSVEGLIVATDGSGGTGSIDDHVVLTSVEFTSTSDYISFVYSPVFGGDGVEGGGSVQPASYFSTSYDASTEVLMGGTSAIKGSVYSWASDSSDLIFGGSAGVSGIFTAEEKIGYSIKIYDIEVNFEDSEEIGGYVAAADNIINKCGCLTLPSIIRLNHNMFANNNFAQFLAHNNYSVPRVTDMVYNSLNDSWQANYHFQGLSTRTSHYENWNVVIDFQCTDEAGGINIGKSIWKLAFQIFRKDVTTLEDYDTRVLLGIIPDVVCSASDLTFSITYDTLLDFATVTPNSTIYQARLYDNIGLFQNSYWEQNPDITINITETEIAESVRTLNADLYVAHLEA